MMARGSWDDALLQRHAETICDAVGLFMESVLKDGTVNRRIAVVLPIVCAASAGTSAAAESGSADLGLDTDTTAEAKAEATDAIQPTETSISARARARAKPVYDDTWATIGIGAGIVPSYAGSNDYIAFPLPLIVGRVAGIGISPNGPGLVLDVNSPAPAMGPRKNATISFGPAFRFRNDRASRIRDEVVARAGTLDAALEIGAAAGVTFPNVLKSFDALTFGAQVRWDVLGAHNGMTVEPQIGYRAPLGRSTVVQVAASAEFVDDNFADYYFTITPAQAIATGLPQFRASGGLNRVGTTAILSFDLDGRPLSGGWSIYGIGGYSRLVGDAADTPFTSVRGNANQFIAGLGVGYTF